MMVETSPRTLVTVIEIGIGTGTGTMIMKMGTDTGQTMVTVRGGMVDINTMVEKTGDLLFCILSKWIFTVFPGKHYC